MRGSRINRTVGAGAGLLALAIVIFAAAGALWGVFQPTYTVTAVDGERLSISSGNNVEFLGFVSFAGATGLLAVGVAMVALMRIPFGRSLAMLVWVLVVSCVGVLTFWVIGEQVGNLIHSIPEGFGSVAGETAELTPRLNLGTAWCVAPLLGAGTYWFAEWMAGVSEATKQND